MTTTTTRRAILAGAAVLPALAAAGLASPSPDPIFEAIEQDKAAYVRYTIAGNIRCNTVDAEWAPEYDADVVAIAEAADGAACQALEETQMALTTTVPTTMAGVLALLDYVKDFNAGAFRHPTEEGWESDRLQWPKLAADGDNDGGADDAVPFAFALMQNVRASLAAMTVQS